MTQREKSNMFLMWHTCLIALFVAFAYWLGYNHGVRTNDKKASKNKTVANPKNRY